MVSIAGFQGTSLPNFFLNFPIDTGVAPPIESKSSIGLNLDLVRDYQPGWVFNNILSASRNWIDHSGATFDAGRQVFTDPSGWVTGLQFNQQAGTLIYREMAGGLSYTQKGTTGYYPTGLYRVFYDGTGIMRYLFDASWVSSGDHMDTFEVASASSNGINFRIASLPDPNDYLRNIHIVHDSATGYYHTGYFHSLFVERLKPFSPLRTSIWLDSSNNPVTGWNQRTTTGHVRQTLGVGVAWEYVAAIANTVDSDLWISIPYAANDDYITNTAQLMKDQLNSDLKLYVEYTNEAWNSIFNCNAYVIAQGTGEGLKSGDDFGAGMRWFSNRSVEVFDIFTGVFSGTDRLIRVFGGWAAVPAVNSGDILGYNSNWTKGDALAIAPYFGSNLGDPSKSGLVATGDISVLIAEVGTGAGEMNYTNGVVAVTRTSGNYNTLGVYPGLRLIGYEGGQHLAGFNGSQNHTGVVGKFVAWNRDPEMYNQYIDYLDMWKHFSGNEMCLFEYITTNSIAGSWGLLEKQDQVLYNGTYPYDGDAYKYNAATGWAADNPIWW